MTCKIVFFLEEPSAREMLNGLLPRLMPEGTQFQYVVFEGKSDLEKRLARKIRGWREPGVHFVVLRDQDNSDCLPIKQRIVEICRSAGRNDTLIRIACREIESWYLADLSAVEAGLEIPGLARLQEKRKYRTPDNLGSPSDELARITAGRYQKISGSRSIGPHLSVSNNRSNSYRVFIDGLKKLMME
jgi:hypothetical protein